MILKLLTTNSNYQSQWAIIYFQALLKKYASVDIEFLAGLHLKMS